MLNDLNALKLFLFNIKINAFSSINPKEEVTEWPPIGKIAAHSAYDMFHGISA